MKLVQELDSSSSSSEPSQLRQVKSVLMSSRHVMQRSGHILCLTYVTGTAIARARADNQLKVIEKCYLYLASNEPPLRCICASYTCSGVLSSR